MLADSGAKDEFKLKAAQELSEHFELITQCSSYQSFLDLAMRVFLKVLQDNEPMFITEFSMQQVRKLILEMIHRLPHSEHVRQYVKPIIVLIIKLLHTENEENVLVCLRILIDIIKQYRPQFQTEILDFLSYLKKIYTDLPKHMPVMLEPRQSIKLKDLKDLNLESLLPDIFTLTPLQVEKKLPDGKTTTASYNLIPKGINSLKVLQELPIIVVLMYQIYKQNLHQEVADFVPLVMNTISLQPTSAHKASPGFNKEIYVDFMGAQIKTLTFSAYIMRLFPDNVQTHASTMVKGMINLLENCPKEVASLRKELLVASRHILQTEFRNHFVPTIEKLFDDDVLLGKGWTTYENLRPLAYSTLADLVHHIRQHLSLQALSKAVHLFAKNIHDESLPTSIQTMSCKLLLNLVECIRLKSDVEPVASRELLIMMLRVFTNKFQTISKQQLPQLMQKWKAKPTEDLLTGSSDSTDVAGQRATSIGLPAPSNLNVSEYRSLIKTLVCGVKTITWGCPATKPQTEHQSPAKLFNPSEILIFIDLFHWALEALDIYTINIPAPGMAVPQPQPVQKQTLQMPRSKEEKEVLEHFSGVFLTMDPQNFQEIFASTIDFMVDRLYKNNTLQVIANSFLANPKTSPLFATVLVEYLLERMEEMGVNIDRSNLYLRLFKLVFGSVSLFAAENEHMLRPHLHNIVNRSMELAMTAKEPYNYFLLLRALFRSIGGGSHDLLYQEFLPLLPNLLEGLNRLQSGFHKQYMKDLFVELCLTVPVRLSSLLPYLPMLMDPLVSALNGSPTLISQGLRTLELCVDNLQPDFLYDHIQPVRADLMQALWRTLRTQDNAAIVAFRVLGKFGGGNRKMMIEPQKLRYQENDLTAPAVVAYFQDHRNPINFAVDRVIETAFNALKSSATEPFYWHQSWEVIHCYLAASITLDDDKYTLQKLFMHPSFTENNVQCAPSSNYITVDKRARATTQTALTSMVVAAATKELRQSVLPTMVAVVRHYTMVAIAQQAGPFPLHKHFPLASGGMDPLVLIDALAEIMGHEEKELCKPGTLAMGLILETATNIMGSKERACRLPLMNYLGEKMAALCYERPWYAKMGGCIALKFLYQNMALRWLYQHMFVFLKAFMFIIMDLTGEVSSGAIDMARTNLEKMLRICMMPLEKECKNEELLVTQKKATYDVIHELVRQVTSPHTLVRETAMASLRLIAELQEKTVTEVMNPHREVLVDMIPPKKHLLRHQPASAQIGLMDGNTFCTTLEPRLFTIDLNILTHKVFYHEVLTLSDADDNTLNKLECFKTVTNLVPLRKSALNALAACHYIQNGSCREKIFQILFKGLEKNNVELQEAAYQCMKNFLQGCSVSKETIHTFIRPMLLLLGDYRNLTLSGTRRLSYLTQLFPAMFNEKLCDSLLQILKKMLEVTITTNKGNFLAASKTSEMEKKIVTILGIFHQIPAASPKFIEHLCKLILQTEKSLMIEPSSPYRPALLKFLLRYPKETIDLLLTDVVMKDAQWNRFTIFLLRHKEGAPFRNAAQLKGSRLMQHILLNSESASATNPGKPYEERYEAQHQAVLIVHLLVEHEGAWITGQTEIITALKNIWQKDLYKTCQTVVVCDLWHLIAKILIQYFSYNTSEIQLLFQLLRALCLRFVPDFQFLRDFLQNTVCQSYTVEWKRKAFFQFVEVFTTGDMAQDLKAKILTAIIIPSFAISFEKGEGNRLVGAPPAPYQEDDCNVVSVFINKVIDPDKPFANEDCVRIALLQFACLLVEKASPHIHDGDANNKREGNKLRRLMTFAWPCLLPKNCVDPSARYHGHLLLSHIIARLAIHKRIVLQVFHSLLKAHAVEARKVVQQALEVLTPAMPLRMEDGNTMLTHWTKKIIVEEGHTMQQLYHILQLIVRHYKVYYPVRHHLVQQMINSMQRLGFAVNTSSEYRRLSIDLADVIIKWEMQHTRDETEESTGAIGTSGTTAATGGGADGAAVRRADEETVPGRCMALVKLAIKPDVPVDLKVVWLDKIFLSVENQQANIGNICTALELLTFLLGVLKKEQILNVLRPLQRGLSACVTCSNTRVIKLMHGLLSRLMAIFPTDAQHKCDELETLYSTISRMIYEGLATYEKSPQANPSTLFGTLMTLKAACSNNPGYIDRLITPFMRLLNRLTKEHLTGFAGMSLVDVANTNTIALELLVVSLDLVKNRVVVMSVEMRKMFIGAILVGLIEKSNDAKVIKAIVKIIEEWMKSNKNTPVTVQQAPTLREKSILLVKLMQYVEKRFADDAELNGQFLELVNYIYRDEVLKVTELTSKLEAAFVAGLRCPNPHIRAQFFEVFDGSMRRRLHDRLLYVICSHAWDSIGQHYWIKQCIELLILTANTNTQIQNSVEAHLLPSISSVINFADPEERKNFVIYTTIQNESTDAFDPIEDKEDAFDMDMSVDSNISRHEESERPVANRQAALAKLISRQADFMEASRKVRTEQLLVAAAQLCHMDTQLAEKVWLDMFPKLWELLDATQQQSLDREIIPFLSSGTHIIQKDCSPTALHTFIEALAQCRPPVYLPPQLMAYLGKAHNLWHRMTLMLESLAADWPNVKDQLPECVDQDDGGTRDCSIVREPLSQMYSALHEEDLWAGLWQKYAKYAETSRAIAHEQMGYFEEAQSIYDSAMSRFKQDLNSGQTPTDMNSEILLWENHWIRCAKELNQWDILMDYGQLCRDKNTYLIMDSAWRVPDWGLMKQVLLKVEQSCPKQVGYKINLYRGYLAILNQEDPQHTASATVERYVELASGYCMREWRRLPPIVSHIHLPILQASQQIMELQEASQIHQGLLQNRTTSLHDMKAIVKTWRNRLPVIADDLSHWSDIFTWRQHHYQIITSHLEQQNEPNAPCMIGAHASAQTIIHFGKIARKQNLTSVCQDSLSRIYTIPSVPIVDCFQKIRQQVKCCLQTASVTSRAELTEALDVIEPTNLDYFTKEMTAEFYALKGLLLAQTGRSEEANKAFSAATQLHDTLIKAWAFWGEYLEHIFTRDYRQIHLGVSAVTCFLHACRNQNESKSRKYLAKVLWLLSYDDDKSSLLNALDKYAVGVPPGQWVPWIPQLLCSLVQYEGNVIMNLLSQVGRMFPQAVYFPIRTLYLTLKIEQRERYKSLEQTSTVQAAQLKSETASTSTGAAGGTSTTTPIRATPPMWRCSKIMHLQRDIHPTVLSSLEGIIDQMVWFRENWYEEVLRQLRQGLTKCYVIAFDNRGAVNETTITQHTLNFIKKLVSTFGIGIENISSSVSGTFASAASESLARRAQATVQDPVFQKMKGQFTSDFDFSQPGAIKLHNLIMKLKVWIKILVAKTKPLPKSFLIEEKCRFLSNFSQKTAEVELPGELLLPKSSHYHIRIARFMPRVDIVQKHNTAARRLYIRGTNGKIYPYLVVNDAGIADARREERLLQLLRMLNSYLVKRKETSRRFLYLTVPRVVAVSPQMRLVEDNPASVSLLEVYKSCCTKLNMEHDAPITRYYERLAKIQARGSPTNHVILRDILKETQSQMVPRTLLKDWAFRTFPSATDYWQFRKMFTLQLSLSCLLEYALCLTRLNPDMIYLHQDSGLMNVSYFRFEMDDSTGLLDVNRPVPFRLTPNIAEFVSPVGVAGPLTASAVATARCFIQPSFKLTTILKAILKDEIIAFHKKRLIDEKVLDQNSQSSQASGSASSSSASAASSGGAGAATAATTATGGTGAATATPSSQPTDQDNGAIDIDAETIITTVNKAVSNIMGRLNNLSRIDSGEANRMSTFVHVATNPDNLCLMDPAWHPWL
ncbi:transcription-associated protein 1 isoform X2 [Anopheles cruzii]|uniref:transcription-associated protein 1 isoform X2 n=1 Tax=Anopheles cruzii TaxID=68878 RepID=UPI0022EC3E12|nr:transcription-associated protein 1 isoform X2 [Anopheles cruzii]